MTEKETKSLERHFIDFFHDDSYTISTIRWGRVYGMIFLFIGLVLIIPIYNAIEATQALYYKGMAELQEIRHSDDCKFLKDKYLDLVAIGYYDRNHEQQRQYDYLNSILPPKCGVMVSEKDP